VGESDDTRVGFGLGWLMVIGANASGEGT